MAAQSPDVPLITVAAESRGHGRLTCAAPDGQTTYGSVLRQASQHPRIIPLQWRPQVSYGVRRRLLPSELMRRFAPTLALAGTLLLAPRAAAACSFPWSPPGWRPGPSAGPPDAAFYAGALVRAADVIVRVRAVQFAAGRPSRADEPPEVAPRGRVTFAVRETLKGRVSGASLVLPGRAVARDEFNPTPVPYRAPRPSAMAGGCVTYEYRLGGDYLLFLKRDERGLTPYWAAVAPVNEQLRDARDPWLRWVRRATHQAPQRT